MQPSSCSAAAQVASQLFCDVARLQVWDTRPGHVGMCAPHNNTVAQVTQQPLLQTVRRDGTGSAVRAQVPVEKDQLGQQMRAGHPSSSG